MPNTRDEAPMERTILAMRSCGERVNGETASPRPPDRE